MISDVGFNKMDKVDHIKEILIKYASAEEQLDRKLEKLNRDELNSKAAAEENSTNSSSESYRLPNLEEAKLRNSNLLKSLEISKARLRSRSTFSPIEHILQQAIENYRQSPSLAPPPSSSSASRQAVTPLSDPN